MVLASYPLAFMLAGMGRSALPSPTVPRLPDLNHLFVHDPDGFPGNYAKLPPPIVMQADVLGMIADWLAQRLRW